MPEVSGAFGELSQSSAELKLIVDAMPALVIYKDASNRVLNANRAAIQAQMSEAAVAARDNADLRVILSGQAELGAIEPIELPGRGKRWFETARLPQVDAAGRVTGLVVVSQDITDRKQLESQLLQARKLESIGRLAGGVAHDFNNLLTSFFGLIAAAQRAVPSDSTAHEYLSLMQLAAEGGANLTRQLLAFARRQPLEPRVVDINGLVRQTSALLNRVLGANITIDMQLSSESALARVDSGQISQLLMNLALNARDAMAEEGRLTFRTASVQLDERDRWTIPGAPSGRYVRLVVEDTGEGLSDEAKEHMFEPFFTSKPMGHGTGLGLSTCYGIVKQNGGHVSVESQRGMWTRFSIYLPEAPPAAVEAETREVVRGPVRAGNETILFAEDDDLVRYLSVAALASSGYRLIEAADGEQALKAIEEHAGPIHLLVTDIIMPKLSGVDLAQRFRTLRPAGGVLFISGYSGDALSDISDEVDVLQKPFTNDTLLTRVRGVLDALAPDETGDCVREV